MKRLLIITAVITSLFGALTDAAMQPPRPALDVEGLRAYLLTPPGCEGVPMPCFLGLQLDRSTPREVYDLVRVHPWVDQSSVNPQQPPNWDDVHAHLAWRWSDNAPYFSGRSVFWNNHESSDAVTVRTTITISDVLAILGTPDAVSVTFWRDYNVFIAPVRYNYFQLHYLELGIHAVLMLDCPTTMRALLQQPVDVIYRPPPDLPVAVGVPPYYQTGFEIPPWLFTQPPGLECYTP